MSKEQDKVVEVVAALIRAGKRFFICQRPADKARPLMWEFPGGKVEQGESHEAALMRECEEELAVHLTVGSLYLQVDHVYPDIHIRLFLYEARMGEQMPQRREHAAFAWITPEEIDQYTFCPADEDILKHIKLNG